MIEGLDPITKKAISYADVDGIYNYVHNTLEVGDTLVKTRGSSTFTVKKRKMNILISYNCLDGSYRGGGVLDTSNNLTYGEMIVDTVSKK